jgi:type IV pilus assembly protein PilO
LFKPGAEGSKDFYAELPIAVRVTGSYHDLGEFVSDVAQMPRIVTLNDIAIEAQKEGNLKFDATAVTYRYLDDEEVARLRREKPRKRPPSEDHATDFDASAGRRPASFRMFRPAGRSAPLDG